MGACSGTALPDSTSASPITVWPTHATTYKVTLPPRRIQLDVAVLPGVDGLVVVDIKSCSVLQKWNVEHPHEAVQRGHVVLEVNSQTGLQQMVDLLRRNSLRNVDLEIVLARDAGPLSAQQQWIFDKTLQHHAAESVMRRIETQQTAEVETCSVCLDDMQMGCEVVKLPCGHRYHPICVKNWLLLGSLNCPLCKNHLE